MELQETTKTEKSQYELIKGVFSADDAMDIISPIIQGKIKFHNLRNLREMIQCESGDEWSIGRMKELKQDRDAINKLIIQAREQGKTLSINSNISIELI